MLTKEKIKQLANTEFYPYLITSFYLNAMPEKSSSRRELKQKTNSLLDEGKNNLRKMENKNKLSNEQKNSLQKDFKAIDDYIEYGFKRNLAKGLAIFSCSAKNFWQAEHTPQPVKNRIVINSGPYIRPLLRIIDEYRHFAMLMLSRDKSKLFRIFSEQIVEHSEIFDEVPGKHGQGGWSQMRFQRHIEDHVNWHVKKTMSQLKKYFDNSPFDYLLLSAPEEILPLAIKRMHPYIKDHYIGNIPMEMNSSESQVLAEVLKAQHHIEAEEQREVLDRVVGNMMMGQKAAWGIEGVLSAASSNNIEELVIERGYRYNGAKCPNCDLLALGDKKCPACRHKLEHIDDIVEELVEKAYDHGAKVIFVDSVHMDYNLNKIAVITRTA